MPRLDTTEGAPTPRTAAKGNTDVTPLVSWAIEHGMAPDSPLTIDSIMKWAATQGCKGKTLDDVIQWASTQGYRQSSYTEVLKAFQALASTIRADAGETPIADEGQIDVRALEAQRALRRRGPMDVLTMNFGFLRSSIGAEGQGREDVMNLVLSVYRDIERGPVPSDIRSADARALSAVSAAITADPAAAVADAAILERYSAIVRALPRNIDVDALVQAVLRESYLETMRDLADQAAKAKFFNDLKKLMRSELEQARQKLAASPTDAEVAGYVPLTFDLQQQYDADGMPIPALPIPGETPLATKAELAAYIENLESQLKTVGDDAQLASVDFQNTLQKQTQLLQTLSAISKLLHTTATSIIQKIA